MDNISRHIPGPPEGSLFSLAGIGRSYRPHPYIITPEHLEFAKRHHGSIVTEYALRDAEARGVARCGKRDCMLPYVKHEVLTTALIQIAGLTDDAALDAVPGLAAYMDLLGPLGIQAVAFVQSTLPRGLRRRE